MRISAAVVLSIAGATMWGQVPVAPTGSKPSPPIQRQSAAGPSSAQPSIHVAPNYVIGPGDILQISVWQEPQFGETVEVRPDGKISVPLVSDVSVAGLTPIVAQERLTEKLQDYVKQPRVSVIVTEVRSRMVYVIGEVQRPGPYPMIGSINVAQLIAEAGGTTEHARKKNVYVLHKSDSRKVPVDYNKVLQGKAPEQNIDLAPGDTVVVP